MSNDIQDDFDVADCQSAVDDHAFNGFLYFDGVRPIITLEFMQSLNLDALVLDSGRDTWRNFLWVNGVGQQENNEPDE
jgi:hypothetical protein